MPSVAFSRRLGYHGPWMISALRIFSQGPRHAVPVSARARDAQDTVAWSQVPEPLRPAVNAAWLAAGRVASSRPASALANQAAHVASGPAGLAVQAALGRSPARLLAQVNQDLKAGRLERLELSAPGQGRTRPVWVYRPFGAETASTPVLYFLHGVPGSADGVVRAGIPQAVDEAIAGGARPFVLVIPDGNGVHHLDTEWGNAADGTDQIETFVTDTVRHAVEGRHPRDARHRAIAGFSMGGYGCANLALRHADLYGQAGSLAGYYHLDDPSAMFAHDPTLASANTPYQHLDRAAQVRFFLADGLEDNQSVVRGEARRLHERLEARGIPSTLVTPHGTHGWKFVREQVPGMVDFLEQGW